MAESPFRNVPENLLPAMKASFLCYSQENREELMELLAKQTVKARLRFDPTKQNYLESIDEFVAKAKADKDKNFLLFIVCASHGYHAAGCQEVRGPYFDIETKTQEFINVEETVRTKFRDVPNTYCVVHFACCREIKKMSDAEVDKLKEELDEKRAQESEEQKA